MTKKLIIMIGIICLYASTCFAVSLADKDKVSYGNGESNFKKTRQVAQREASAEVDIGTTNIALTLPSYALSVLVINDHASNNLFVNPDSAVANNTNADNAYTTAGSNIMDLNTPRAALGLQVGDLITLDEGDANDGVYAIIGLPTGTNTILLDRNLTVTHAANQDYLLQSFKVKAGESIKLDIGTRNVALVASASGTTTRLIITYQKEN